MPIVDTNNQSITGLSGIHVWHDGMSSCSQRVRTVLAAKDKDWEDHRVELMHAANFAPEFLAINPKGLVPVLVHDGTLVTESVDIIDYLDTAFPSPSLRPNESEELAQMREWLALADAAQFDLKVLSHEFLLRAVRKVSDEDLERIRNDVVNDDLVDFLGVYTDGDYLPAELVSESVNRTDERFCRLDNALEGRHWLAGATLSLGDIAWMPNAHRFELMDWPLEKYPNFHRWHTMVKELPSYRAGIVKWEPPSAREMFSNYVQTRGEAGYHVGNFGVLSTS